MMNPINNDGSFSILRLNSPLYLMLHKLSVCKCQNDSLCFHLASGVVQSQVVHIGHIVHFTSETVSE